MYIGHKIGREFDVAVIGGGPSGCAAAIAAARRGASVLLAEKEYCLGGMWTSGLVAPVFDCENKGGILAEIISDLRDKGCFGGFWGKSFNFEYMKVLLEEKCLKAGAAVLLDTCFLDVLKEGNRAAGVYVKNTDGITYYGCDVLIDASGDAEAVRSMGARVFAGEDGNVKACQAMTLMFLIGGVPQKYADGLVIYDVVEKAFEKEEKGNRLNFDMPYLIPIPNSDMALIQLTHMYGYSPLSAADRTAATIEGRRQMVTVFEALKNYDEDFADSYLITSANVLGVRESVRIDGEYCLTDDDILSGAKFEDAVTTVTFGADFHNGDTEKQKCFEVKPYQIPFRAMLPKGTENIIVAGKTISGSRAALASYRVTGNCCAMGEAAGNTAAYAALNGMNIREAFEDMRGRV